jgi:glycine betaine/proline transport system substrate-binding protein
MKPLNWRKIMNVSIRKRQVAVSLAALMAVVPLVGCGANASSSGKVTIEAAQYSWPAAIITNAILAQVIEDHPDLGVDGMETTQLDPATAWAGAKRGDIDMITEVSIPNQVPMADEAAETMEIVSETYSDAEQGWFVPAYTVKPGGAAEGLKSITQLNEYSDVFDRKLYDADPGYVTTKFNEKRLEAYAIDYEQVAITEAAQLAQLQRAYNRKEPILVFLYHPHWVFAAFDLVKLDEPHSYTDACLTEGDGKCALPDYSIGIALSKELIEAAPKFADFIENFRISVSEMEDMMKAQHMEKEPPRTIAAEWISQHEAEIQSWLKP